MTLPASPQSLDPGSQDDRALVARSRLGDATAFTALVHAYAGRVRHLLLRRGTDASLADDLTQETFVLAWRNLSSFKDRGDSSFLSWLFTIAVRSHATHLRTAAREHRRAGALSIAAGHAAPPQPEPPTASADLWDLADALLSPQARTALWLRYVEGLSPSQIARVLNCSAVSVRVTLLRARTTLRTAAQPVCIPTPTPTPAPAPAHAPHLSPERTQRHAHA